MIAAVLTRAEGVSGYLFRRPGLLVALAVIGFVTLAAVAPGCLTRYQPFATVPAERLMPPGVAHPFGTDGLGRDLYTRLIYGSGLSLCAAGLAIAIAMLGGVGLGVISGFAGGIADTLIMRLIDVTLALPPLLLALAIVTAIGFGITPVSVAVGVGIIPGFARITRAEVLRVRTLPYIEAARLCGASRGRVLWRHVLPNSCGPVAALAILDFGAVILAIAGLSFLGFGAAPPASDWGGLVADGRDYMATAPWLSLIPGFFIMALILSINRVSLVFGGRTS